MSPKLDRMRASAKPWARENMTKGLGSNNGCSISSADSDSESETVVGSARSAVAVAGIESRFWAKVNKTATCWLWTAAGFGKYDHGQFALPSQNGRQRHVYAHRYSWELVHGPIPDGKVICHKCDVPRCVNPAHLFLGTQADNLNDARRKGRLDESLPRSRALSYSDRVAIYLTPDYRGVGRDLSRRYGVSKCAVSHIRRGRFAGAPTRAFGSRVGETPSSVSANTVSESSR